MKKMKNIQHYKSDAITIEKTIKKLDYYPTKNQLWKALPKRISYRKLCLVLKYLEKSGKILICRTKEIIWIYNPKLLKKTVKLSSVSAEL